MNPHIFKAYDVRGIYPAELDEQVFHDIGRAFIAAAAAALVPGGRLWLVANRNLPYELELDANFGSVRIVTQQQGFKIVEAIKGAAAMPQPATPVSAPARNRRASNRAAETRAWRDGA